MQIIQILAEFGPTLPFPYSSQVEGKLRELRTHYGKRLFRILYYQDSNGVFVLLHAFEKQSRKLPEREMRIGFNRMIDDQKRKGG
ncbi:MAG: type II toxin-antitoxin system RelE/ParE family toxin [bacterium]